MHRSTHALLASLLILVSITACAPAPASTPYVPPAPLLSASPTFQPSPTLPAATQTPIPSPVTAEPTPTEAAPTTAAPCTNDLSFVQDLTIPDGSIVQAGGPLEKEWLVANTGTCHWDSGYRLKLVGGEAMGAPLELALHPARAGTQATIRINFTAPLLVGIYQSAWQAFAPDGTPFGDAFYMNINVGT